MNLDHIVISVSNLKRSIKFYNTFLGIGKVSSVDAYWVLGNTKLFLTKKYKVSAREFDKNNLGLNHIAIKVSTLKKLKELGCKLDKVNVKHSSIISDKYNPLNQLVWFNDPDGIRLEFYYRK